MTPDQQLKPCPFCGERYLLNLVKYELKDCYAVECMECLVTGPFSKHGQDRAIELWNTRAECQ